MATLLYTGGGIVGDVHYETLDNCRTVAKLVNHTVYLKGTNRTGWRLSDIAPDVPYFVIDTDGNAHEVES